MNKTYSDYHYEDIADFITGAVPFSTYVLNGPVYECVYEVTEESIWIMGHDLMASGNTDTLDFWDYRHIDGDITDIPYFLEGLYMVTEDISGNVIALAKEGEEPLD